MFVGAALLVCLAAALSNGIAAEQSGKPAVIIETNMGSITVELYPDKAPKTVENFLEYVKSGFYKGTIFHRVIKGFMIQGGGYGVDMLRKQTRPAIPIESNNKLSNKRGTIAMARTADPNSATAQFFINTADNKSLDYTEGNPGYTVFGKVTAGMDVVDKIESAPTGAKGPFTKDFPLQTIGIKNVTLKP
jgi:cyclophilin family peptidyl-prolyl cis-trans isomerase